MARNLCPADEQLTCINTQVGREYCYISLRLFAYSQNGYFYKDVTKRYSALKIYFSYIDLILIQVLRF